jgi:adenylate cyclase
VKATFEDVGNLALKNIEQPIQAFRVGREPADWEVAAVSAAQSSVSASVPSHVPLTLPDRPSIAVLPFQNMSGDPEQEYFADGMVEDITTALSRSKRLFVIARNSSSTYKGKAVDIKQVGRELGVRYVLEGSVRKAGNRVRITGQLIDAESRRHLWADRFESALDDIFDLQDRITESVVGAIAPKLEQSEFERANRKPTANLTAYDYYLRGHSKFQQFKRETLVEALPLFKKAIELDPEFALPYATAAGWHCFWIASGWSEDRAREVQVALPLARKAIDLDKDDAFVLSQSAWTLAYLGNELDDAIGYLKRATSADPNSALAWRFQGLVSVLLGRHDDAIEYFQRTLRLDPLDPQTFTTYSGLTWAHFLSGHYEEASLWGEASLHENPHFLGCLRVSIACHALSGRIAAAKASWARAFQINPTQRISNIRDQFPLRRDEDVARLAEGLRLAGMPE